MTAPIGVLGAVGAYWASAAQSGARWRGNIQQLGASAWGRVNSANDVARQSDDMEVDYARG